MQFYAVLRAFFVRKMRMTTDQTARNESHHKHPVDPLEGGRSREEDQSHCIARNAYSTPRANRITAHKVGLQKFRSGAAPFGAQLKQRPEGAGRRHVAQAESQEQCRKRVWASSNHGRNPRGKVPRAQTFDVCAVTA